MIAIGLCSSSHVHGDVVIFHLCDCSQKLIALEAILKARSQLSELNANGCFYKELFSLVVLSWSLYYWVMGFYYEGCVSYWQLHVRFTGWPKMKGCVALSLNSCLLISLYMNMSVNFWVISMTFSHDGKLTQVCLFEIYLQTGIMERIWKKRKREAFCSFLKQFEFPSLSLNDS